MIDDTLTTRLATAHETWRRHQKVTRGLAAARIELTFALEERRTAAVAVEREREDVKRYEGLSLRSFFADLAGSLGERRAEERRQLATAVLKHEQASAQVAALRAEIERLQSELGTLGSAAQAEQEYAEAFAACESALAEGPLRDEILAASRRHSDLLADRRELDEAIEAGRTAALALGGTGDLIAQARRAGFWDVLGGGMFVTMWKHQRMDDARYHLHAASVVVDKFRRELRDVSPSIRLDTGVLDMSQSMRFADYFLDGIADWFVQGQINRAERAVDAAREDVDAAIAWLQQRRDRLQADLAEAAERRRALVDAGIGS